MDPYDVDTLRYAVRSSAGSGYLFLNNFQDHAENYDLCDFNVSIELPEETIVIPSQGELTLARDSFAILPFNFNLDGMKLKYATAQLITRIEEDGEAYYFFFVPEGMKGTYVMESKDIISATIDKGSIEQLDGNTIIKVAEEEDSLIHLVSESGQKVAIYTMTDEQSLTFWKVNMQGRDRVILTNANVLVSEGDLRLESTDQEMVTLSVFPDFDASFTSISGGELLEITENNVFKTYRLKAPKKEIHFNLKRINNDKFTLDFELDAFHGIKEALLRIHYTGDIGYAFIDGELINDNFCNHTTWEIGLKAFEHRLIEQGLYVYVSSIRKGKVLNSNTTMAGWKETTKESIVNIGSVSLVPVYEIKITI
jgi:hypothetical protein